MPVMILRARFETLIEQTHLARDYGFDCVHAGQHYLHWPLQMLQPIPLLGRLAGEAGDMELGTSIILLTLLHPVDMAEQIATLDIMTGGRFVFGVGLGYMDVEFSRLRPGQAPTSEPLRGIAHLDQTTLDRG